MIAVGRLAVLWAALVVTPPVGAQLPPPANDRCADALAVDALPFDGVVPTGGATLDPDEPGAPACGGPAFAHSVWYALTVPADGVYVVSTCGSDFDTVLQLYDGDPCDALDRETTICSDDADLCGPGARQSLIVFRAGEDDAVHVQVGSGAPTAGTLHVAMRLAPRATNDACAAARVVDHPVFREILDVAGTGADPADRGTLSACGGAGDVRLGDAPHSVWYLYTPATAGTVGIDTAGTTTPHVVAIFAELAEGCARLGARVACGADAPVEFAAEAGRTYRIYVATAKSVAPDTLVFRLTGPNAPPVARAAGPAAVAPGAAVGITATGSTDPDGDPLAYAWTQTDGPAVALSDPASAAPTFTAPAVAAATPLAFALAVTDGAAVATATLAITVRRSRPTPTATAFPRRSTAVPPRRRSSHRRGRLCVRRPRPRRLPAVRARRALRPGDRPLRRRAAPRGTSCRTTTTRARTTSATPRRRAPIRPRRPSAARRAGSTA
jgi:hypothetical protein